MSIISGSGGGGVSQATLNAAVGGVAWTVVTKALDESVTSSAVLQADDELFFTPVSNGIYELQLDIVYGSPAGGGTPDISITFGEDATSRGVLSSIGLSASDVVADAPFGCVNNATGVSRGTAATNRNTYLRGVYYGNGVQTGLLWCQNVSGVNATIVRAGSVLRYRRIV